MICGDCDILTPPPLSLHPYPSLYTLSLSFAAPLIFVAYISQAPTAPGLEAQLPIYDSYSSVLNIHPIHHPSSSNSPPHHSPFLQSTPTTLCILKCRSASSAGGNAKHNTSSTRRLRAETLSRSSTFGVPGAYFSRRHRCR